MQSSYFKHAYFLMYLQTNEITSVRLFQVDSPVPEEIDCTINDTIEAQAPGAYTLTSTLILKHMQLIDGTGCPPQERSILVIQSGRIAYVGPEAGWTMAAEEPATELDLSGRTVLPGLIDCHVH